MERIIKISITFVVNSLVGLLTIIIASGKLTWATAGLVALVVLVTGLGVGVWTVVHGHFERSVEIGLTLAIVTLTIVAFVIIGIAGSAIWHTVAGVFGNSAAWWLIAPVIGTVTFTFLFGLHKQPRRSRR